MRRALVLAVIAVPAAVYLHQNDSFAELAKDVRVQEFRHSLETQSADALLKMRTWRTAIEESAVKQVQMLREQSFSRESFLKFSSEFYNLSLERASELNAALQSNGHKIYRLSLQRASELKTYLQSNVSELKAYLRSDRPAADWARMLEWLKKDQPASAIAAMRALPGQLRLFPSLVLLAATTVLLSMFRMMCCRRHRVAATRREAATVQQGGAPLPMMKAPTPLRSGFELRERQQPAVQRRRRSDSPAPTATMADAENTAPASENLLHKLNHDSAEDLVAINGLGDKSAAKIVNWRQKNGPLKNIDDLAKCGLSAIVVSNLRRSQLGN